jgi:hypothetical protein
MPDLEISGGWNLATFFSSGRTGNSNISTYLPTPFSLLLALHLDYMGLGTHEQELTFVGSLEALYSIIQRQSRLRAASRQLGQQG